MQKFNKPNKILFTFLLCIVIIKAQAQTGLNFQGVARTSNNVILASQPISLRLSILHGSASGTTEYTETRKVTTNAQGLFSVVIGDTGAISTLGNFSTINWKNTPKFLKIEMDPADGNNFITMGTTQFQYVAYAQFAKSVDADNIAGIVPIVKGGTGASSLASLKSTLALDKLNNTADTDKPISAKTQTALDLKLNAEDTSKYAKQIWTDSALLTKINNTDTIKYVKKTYADSSLVTKLRITDTAAMLSNRIGKDTLSLSNRINLKANLADFNNINTTLSSKLNLADTIKYSKQTYTDSSLLTKLKITDTAAMLSNRIGKDTLNLSARINAKANTSDVTTSLALKENASNKSTAVDLGGTSPSDILFPTQKAVKDYVTANASSGGVADGGITTIKLADGAVTDAKLATGISKSKVGLGNVENTALSTWAGSNNLATVGTITSGTWSGTAVAIEKGGTGATTQQTAINAITGTQISGRYLRSDGTNATLSAIQIVDVPTLNQNTMGNAATATTAGNITATVNTTLTSLSSLATVGTITSGVWSGTAVAVEKGGTGATTASAARTNLGLVIGTNVQAPLVAGTDYLTPTGSAASLTNFPTLNQNTTGNAATATTAGNITATTNTTLTSLSNLATVGTITSGVWSGTAVAVEKGGTGLTSAGINGQVLTSTGSGTLTWTTPVFLPTVVIGKQQWMRENLDVMTYRNGDVIPQVTDATEWAGLTTGAWCYYNNDPLNGAIYGKLYNWYAVNDPRGLAPQGWHIPTDAEWTTLSNLLGGSATAGGKMKTTGTTRWTSNTNATNESGFSGLPGGYRYGGTFFNVGFNGLWWSATQFNSSFAWSRFLLNYNGDLYRTNDGKWDGFSVRCLRD